MSDTAAVLLQAINAMDGSVGFDAIIVCTSNIAQENYWQQRLTKTTGKTARDGALILAVHEDWGSGGAGNGLGTLYAYTKARNKAKEEFGVDLDEKITKGWSVGMYHTAGKGTRLAPLPGSENNNKPGVKLSSMLEVDGVETELTILEAVIRQTNSYAPHRKGRLSVFWGDQVFIPSEAITPSGSHPADILAQCGPMPSESEWKERGLDKYGLIAVNAKGNAAQVEKVSYQTAMDILKSFGEIAQVGPSLGSFSLSAALLIAFLSEFSPEIKAKVDKFDSDPHFWMPMTLPKGEYSKIMVSKGSTAADADKHFARLSKFVDKFKKDNPCDGMLGCISTGASCYWWDYGQVTLYAKNNLLATKDTPEAHALRTFLQIKSRSTLKAADVSVDGKSVVMGCKVDKGSIKESVCSTVECPSVDVEGCVLVNVSAKKIKARDAIIYNVVDTSDDGIEMVGGGGEVRADVFMPKRDKIILRSNLETDGGKAWKVKTAGNSMSFEEVYEANGCVDIIEAQALARAAKHGK
eukprot:CAMPEP_0169442256 /NCGR_PEP_ID=MMETSP1042-20121227/8730_1 /TAXON_ID=464988 /ORGANISM="Hemiselmis andersenii, Strain CCMP1180" /LENGTH=522 /DNA_ID=CAMNT_0009553415 /DNA_START=109 /DNA_END=1677 /DNA_ORIENTATION=-